MRKSLKRFAEFQEKVLQDNDYKGGWDDSPIDSYLFLCLEDEVYELGEALGSKNLNTIKGVETIQKECANSANFSMMIFDKLEQIKERLK